MMVKNATIIFFHPPLQNACNKAPKKAKLSAKYKWNYHDNSGNKNEIQKITPKEW